MTSDLFREKLYGSRGEPYPAFVGRALDQTTKGGFLFFLLGHVLVV